MEGLKQLRLHRARIDDIDRQIIDLLARRYAVIREVGELKKRHGIASVLPDRIDEVCENAASKAAREGLDAGFIRDLFSRIIEHSCGLEDRIMDEPGQTRRDQQANG
jgi:chorismate mutase-like protein